MLLTAHTCFEVLNEQEEKASQSRSYARSLVQLPGVNAVRKKA